MDISTIISNLKTQVKNGSKIELNATLLSKTQLEAIRSSFGMSADSLITINSVTDIPEAIGNSVTINSGTVEILQQTGLQNIQIIFNGGTETNIIFYIPMPTHWELTGSFATLTLFPFNILQLTDAYFVYSSHELSAWPLPNTGTVNLSAGLNFGSQISLKGLDTLSNLLGNQTPVGTLSLTGTIAADTQNPYPLLQLTADLGIPSFTILPGLDLKKLGLALQVTQPDDNGEQNIDFGIAADTTDLDFNLMILDGGSSLSFNVSPQPGFQATLANLAKTELSSALLPGVDFSSLVPGPIASVFANDIAFNGFSVVLLLDPRQVMSISLSIGQTSGTAIDLSLFKLTGFTFDAVWISPNTSSTVTVIDFKASGKVPIAIFKDEFEFEIHASEVAGKWEIDSIYAYYAGSITMAGILQEISPTTEIPDFLRHISFSDFVASAQPAEDQFTLSCLGTVALNFMDRDFAASVALVLNKTASQTTFKINAQCVVGGLFYKLNITLADSSISGSSFSIAGTAHYSGKFDMLFNFSLDQKQAVAPKTGEVYTIKLEYVADAPPKLNDFLVLLAENLGLDAAFPGGLDIDAEMDALTVEIVKEGTDAIRIDLAGLFKLTVNQLEWQIYLSYTNDAYFQSEGPEKRALGPNGDPVNIFGVALSGDIGLDKLLLVGKVPGVGDLTIKKLGFYYTNAVFSTTLTKLNFTVASLETVNTLSPTPDAAFLTQAEFSLLALFGAKGDNSTPNSLPLPVATGVATPGQPSFQKTQSLPKDPISWLVVNKTLGPVDVIKIGLGYEKPDGNTQALGIVGLYITGAFAVGGLSMVLDRLGVTFPIPKPGSGLNPLSDIGFHLEGMFLEYKGPSFEIAGGFINLPGGSSVNMTGEFIVQFGNFGLQAYGGYSDQLSSPSLFIFLHLNAPLGGPPFFFITGVSGGFGVNRGFKLPTFDELGTYPLLPSSPAIPAGTDLAGKSQEDKLKEMTNALVNLASYFPVEEGEYWLAAGLDVTSFEMITVSAVLSVAFGVTLQIGVVGSASITIPMKEPEPIAFVQINFVVSYSSASEMLAVMGAITPSSFIYAGLVHISGGFAFNTWFGGPHGGDFVLTIGGYNSHFTPPDNYPIVPRIELRAGIGPVNMVGQAYFALLPSMIMAGMNIKATADLGSISAWFDASLDFVMGWKPFHYEITASVEIGASFTIDLGFIKTKITIHVGVFLDVWGPAFGGKAKIDLDIITFTIYFGADPNPAPLLGWSEFKQFLPSITGDSVPKNPLLAADILSAEDLDTNPTLVNIVAKTGLSQSFEPGHEVDELNWIVDANNFDIRTQSTAPITNINFNGAILPQNYEFLDPAQLNTGVKKALDDQLKQPYFAYTQPKADEGPWWNQIAYGIPTMGLIDIKSTHIVKIYSLDNQGRPHEKVNDFIITLKTSGVPPSLWNNGPIDQGAVTSPDTVIKNSLVELSILPMIWFPKRTTFIPYYYLVFDSNNLFLEQDVAPVLKAPDFNPIQTNAIYQQMQNGTAFSSTQNTRSSIVNILTKSGFGELSLKKSEQLSTQDYVDDPLLTYMSSLDETQLI